MRASIRYGTYNNIDSKYNIVCVCLCMRNASIYQEANRYGDAAAAARRAGYLFQLIVDGDELRQVCLGFSL
jgi:hypothetical protein